MKKRIDCIWFLTDDILPPLRLEAPQLVREALLSAGEIDAPTNYKSELKSEWIYRRTWRYRGSFAVPEDGKRAVLSVDGLFGSWTILVNGREAAKGDGVCAEAEITALLQSGRNDLDIVFSAPDANDARPEIGFSGACQMRNADAVMIRDFQMAFAPDGAWVARVTTDSKEAVECDFMFTLSGKEGSVERTQRVSLAGGTETHELTPFDDAPGKGARARVALAALVDGRVSDDGVFMEYIPDEGTASRGFRTSDEFSVSQVARAGGNAVCAADSANNRVMIADQNLAFIPYAPGIGCRALAATPDMDALTALLGDDVSEFEKDAAWRLTGSDRGLMDETRARMGGERQSLRLFARNTRYYQAVDLRERAELARLHREAFLLDDVFDKRVRCASQALFDGNAPRPAYFALMNAWKADHAFAQPPESYPDDGIVNIPIYYVSDNPKQTVSVSASVYMLNGQEVVSASFPVFGRANNLVGRICVEIPEDECFVLRTRVIRRGATLSVSDTIITRDSRKLLHLDTTQLLLDGNELKNVGPVAAVGVAAAGADYFGILLPGERVILTNPEDRQVEGLNIIF